MLRLFLMRHAKSSWAVPGQRDFDRPLNERGRAAAPLIGRHMAEMGYLPDRVLCSPAARTRATLEGVQQAIGAEAPVVWPRLLYEASVEGVFAVIASHGEAAERLMVIGHNPSVHMLALAFAHDGDAAQRARLRGKYPTAALTVIDLPVTSWSAIRPGGGTLVAHVTPADLGLAGAD